MTPDVDIPAHLPADVADVPPQGRRRVPPLLLTILTNLPWVLLLALLLPAARFVEDPDRVDPYHARVIMLAGINITLAVSLQLINGISGQFSLGHAGFMAVGAYVGGYATATYANNFDRPASPLLFLLSLAAVVLIVAGVGWGIHRAIGAAGRVRRWLPNVLFLLLMVWVVADLTAAGNGAHSFGMSFGVRPGFAVFLRIPLVWSRLFGFIGTTYTTMTEHGERPLTFTLALLGGGIAAALVGLVVGLPTLRLRGDYLAIATLGFAAIIERVIQLAKPLGGAMGLQLTPYAVAPDPATNQPGHFIFPWIYGTAILTTLVVWRLSHSAKGRAIKAVREDEVAAAATGIDTTHYKIVAFVVGAFFAGVAGTLYAHFEGYANASQFNLTRSIEIVVMVTLGGLGNIWGAIVAAIVLTFLPEVLRSPAEWLAFILRLKEPHVPQWLVTTFAAVGDNRMVVFSALLIAIMLAKGRNYGALLPRWRRRSEAAAASG